MPVNADLAQAYATCQAEIAALTSRLVTAHNEDKKEGRLEIELQHIKTLYGAMTRFPKSSESIADLITGGCAADRNA